MANDLEQVQVAPNKHQLAQTSGSSRRPVSAGAYVLAEPSPTARWNPAAHLNESQLGASRARIEPNNEVDNFVSSRGHSSDASGQQGDNNSGVQDGARPGAVMGIFFKVWSLVKGKSGHCCCRWRLGRARASLPANLLTWPDLHLIVTKGRNQAHKMRRQTSAEPSQLRGSPSWPVEQEHGLITGKTAPITRLKDDHFRRAGSQPAPSVRARSGQANMLQVKSTTGSTSSGVSSATSGDGAFSSPGAGRSSSSAVRRHLSAYSLRRSTADTPLSGPNAVLSDGSTSPTGTGQKERSLSGSASSWASRIKRSATTVNQADLSSYVSKYKFKRVHEQPDSAAPLIKHQHSPPAPPVPAQAHTRRATIPPPESELGQAAEAGATKARRLTTVSASTGSASDLDDSNDIYSTPHDSVQSVPSSAPLYPMSERIAPTVHQVTSQAYPIIKSFSTSNFGQLLAGTRQQLAIGPGQFKPIAELDSAARQVELDNELPDAPAKVDGSAPARGSRRHMANSRFFISSSSSEDSTSGQHQQKAAGPGSSTPAHQVESQASCDSSHLQLELRNRLPLSVLQGSHYHAAARPDSLILAQPSLVGTQALMSPLDWSAPSPFVRRPSRSFRPLEPTQISAGPKRPSLVSSGLTQFPTTKCGPVVARDPAVAPSHDSGRLNLAEPQAMPAPPDSGRKRPSTLINSVSLYDCKLPALANLDTSASGQHDSEYRLANMLLEFGSNPHVKDENGNTVLMHACLSDNLSTVRCLLERNVDPDEENNDKLTALDLVCSKESSACRLSILDLLIENKANVDRQDATGLRLLDRLVAEHQPGVSNKLPYIECLLRNGAKLGSSTWAAAAGKHDVQLRLLKKLCHDGYFLYKVSGGVVDCSLLRVT